MSPADTLAADPVIERDDLLLQKLDLDDPRWVEFVTGMPTAMLFHHPVWAKTLSECYGYPAFVLARLQDGRVTAGFPVMEVKRPWGPRRWVSLPFTDYCPPLDSSSRGDALLAEANAVARDAGVERLEIRAPVAGPSFQSRLVGVRHTLRLDPNADVVRRSFHRSTKYDIKFAERSPVSVHRGEVRTDLTDAFYGLHMRTRRRQGVPVQPQRFFELLWQHVIGAGFGFVLLAYAGTTPIAGAVYLVWGKTTIHKYGASNPDFLNLRPNHLVAWDAIRWACENGYSSFDFGRSDLANVGLRAYKNKWGTREDELRYSGIGGLASDPPRSLQRALATIIRASPLSVTRALGELLYPFAA